jgi:hypothetical protein
VRTPRVLRCRNFARKGLWDCRRGDGFPTASKLSEWPAAASSTARSLVAPGGALASLECSKVLWGASAPLMRALSAELAQRGIMNERGQPFSATSIASVLG